VSAPNGALVQQLLDGALGGAQAEAAVAQAQRAYREALHGLPLRPKQLHSTVEQLCLLALFNAALAAGRSDTHARTAASLGAIADALVPGACADPGLPSAPAAAEGSTAAPRAARSASKSATARKRKSP
jgi:hypothetical protein